MYPYYLGIDLHLKRAYVVLMDQGGNILGEYHISTNEIQEFIVQDVPKHTYAVIEATRNWPFLYDLLQEHVDRVELAHPKELKAISTAAVKTDRIDARVLANLARLNYLPIAYAAPVEIRDLRLHVRHRDTLVRQRTQAKNRIHAILARYNITFPMADLFGVKGRAHLREACEHLLRPAACHVIQDNLALIDQCNEQIEVLENELEFSPEQAQTIRLLKTIPGIGQIIAITLLAEIGDIQRFSSPKALCNWAGLTPRIRNSDRVIRHGNISKKGSPYVRGAMTRAATIASRVSKRWYGVHEHLMPRCGKVGAKVAVARRLLTVAYYIWKRNTPYQEDYGRDNPARRGA